MTHPETSQFETQIYIGPEAREKLLADLDLEKPLIAAIVLYGAEAPLVFEFGVASILRFIFLSGSFIKG